MAWRAHEPLEHDGVVYGQKNVEFERFLDLPRRTSACFELAIGGMDPPLDRLRHAGWRTVDAEAVTVSFDSWREYIGRSRAEFTVCKNVFVATNSGWFSDRSAVYLACGRPVILQDTGFSDHLPCGEGLFAVRTVDEAAAAVERIQTDYARQSRAAREIAAEYLSAPKVLPPFLDQVGVG
jgi:hypothetical protein